MTGTLIVKGRGGGTGSGQSFTIPLLVPKRLTGANITIPVERAGVQVFAKGPKTTMWTYGGTYPGPDDRPARRPGHEGHVRRQAAELVRRAQRAPARRPSRGDVRTGSRPRTCSRRATRAPTTTRSPTAAQPEHASFFYYHDHRMLRDRPQQLARPAGHVPRRRGRDEQFGCPAASTTCRSPISDRSFTSTNQLKNPFPAHPMMEMTGPSAPPNDETVGNTILVNGRYSPYFNVATRPLPAAPAERVELPVLRLRTVRTGSSFTAARLGRLAVPASGGAQGHPARPVAACRRRRRLRRRVGQAHRAQERAAGEPAAEGHRHADRIADAVPRHRTRSRHASPVPS